RIESYASTSHKGRIRCLEQQRIDRYRASEPLRPTPDGRLRANSFDVHISYSLTSRLSYVVTLFPKPLEPIRQLRSSLAAVGEFANEQRERLRASSDPESASIHRIKARVMDQLGSDILGTLVVAAIHQARPSFFAFGFEYSEQHFTGNGVESQNYMSAWNFLCEFFGSRRSGAHDEFRVCPRPSGGSRLRSPCLTYRLPASAQRRFATNARPAEWRLHLWQPRLAYRRVRCPERHAPAS